jgi:hypothetical protein
MMFEADAAEFPFVGALPKREKSKLAKAWENFQELGRISEREGMLIPQVLAARLLDMSRQRVNVLASEGRLKVIQVNGQSFVTGNSVRDYAQVEHKSGRPAAVPTTYREGLRRCYTWCK